MHSWFPSCGTVLERSGSQHLESSVLQPVRDISRPSHSKAVAATLFTSFMSESLQCLRGFTTDSPADSRRSHVFRYFPFPGFPRDGPALSTTKGLNHSLAVSEFPRQVFPLVSMNYLRAGDTLEQFLLLAAPQRQLTETLLHQIPSYWMRFHCLCLQVTRT